MDYDIHNWLGKSGRLQTDDMDWQSIPDHPLNRAEVRFLRYMMNIEDHTVVYLKELLCTDVIREPDVTAFLSCWAYEEFWHGNALERFLQAYHGPDTPTQDRDARFQREGRLNRVAKKVAMPLISAVSPDFAATHMTWGATNELTTLTGYEALSRHSRHPFLKELLARIVQDERRHFAFYFNQAKERLTDSPRQQRITRSLMDRAWTPVGANVYDDEELDAVTWYLFRDEEDHDAMRRVDATIATLPGMEGWSGLTDAVAAAIGRHEARPDHDPVAEKRIEAPQVA